MKPLADKFSMKCECFFCSMYRKCCNSTLDL